SGSACTGTGSLPPRRQVVQLAKVPAGPQDSRTRARCGPGPPGGASEESPLDTRLRRSYNLGQPNLASPGGSGIPVTAAMTGNSSGRIQSRELPVGARQCDEGS